MTKKEHKKITGFETPEEFHAYEKGREVEEKVILDWIDKWDGSTNSVLGDLLDKKFKELQSNLT